MSMVGRSLDSRADLMDALLWRRAVLDGRESLWPTGAVLESRLVRAQTDALVRVLSGGRLGLPTVQDAAPATPDMDALTIRPIPRPYGMDDKHPLVLGGVYQ